MDIITITSEVKETIDLDKMSQEDLKKVVKHLWHTVEFLLTQVDINKLNYYTQSGGIAYPKDNITF